MPKEFKPLDPAGRALEKLLGQRPVLWVGAGMSIAAGYPSTGQLVDRIRERSFDPIPEGLAFTEVADRFVANNTAAELSDLLQQTIGPSRDPTPTLRAVGQAAGQSDDPLLHLWQQVETAETDDRWNQALAALQEDGLTGAALAGAVTHLADRRGGLLVYLDDAESLQNRLGDGELAEWSDPRVEQFWTRLSAAVAAGGPLGVLASCRYWIQQTAEQCHLALPPMAAGDTLKLLRWFPTLSRIPRTVQDWLATEVVDGHPRTAEFLEELAARRERDLVGPQGRYAGRDWRGEILQPILPQTRERINADLLLPRLWQALDDPERQHLGRCSVLANPAPWPAVTMLAQAGDDIAPPAETPNPDTAEHLARAGLLSPTPVPGLGLWWSPHRLVAIFAQRS